MSFSSKVKEEITIEECEKTEKIALLSSYIRNNAVITDKDILINTENIEISKYIYSLLQDLYRINPIITVRKNFNFKKSVAYLIRINKKKDIILKDLSLMNSDGYLINIPREYIYESDDDKRSYLKGLFLAVGSINDPKTAQYHLEFLIDDYDYSVFICELLDDYNLNSKLIERTNGFMVYIKESEKISDFLKLLKVYKSVLYYEDIKTYKEQKNLINRINNCEQANTEKTINSAKEQINNIKLIDEVIGIEALDDKLKVVAQYRLKYEEESLTDLSKIISLETNTNLTKSGLNHRLRKIKDIALSLKNK